MNKNTGDEADLLIKNKTRLVIIIIAIIAFLAIIAAVFYRGYKKAEEKYESIIKELEEENKKLSDPVAHYEVATKEVNIELINSEIHDIGELATVEYLYTDAGKFEDPAKLFGKEVPFSFTTKSFIAKWDGVIKAGVIVDEITVEKNDMKKEIVVHIPKVDILSHETIPESIETLDEKDGLFNPVKVDDVRDFDAVSKDAMEQRAIENGILEKAAKNAKDIIYKIIDTDLVEELEYSIIFSED